MLISGYLDYHLQHANRQRKVETPATNLMLTFCFLRNIKTSNEHAWNNLMSETIKVYASFVSKPFKDNHHSSKALIEHQAQLGAWCPVTPWPRDPELRGLLQLILAVWCQRQATHLKCIFKVSVFWATLYLSHISLFQYLFALYTFIFSVKCIRTLGSTVVQ